MNARQLPIRLIAALIVVVLIVVIAVLVVPRLLPTATASSPAVSLPTTRILIAQFTNNGSNFPVTDEWRAGLEQAIAQLPPVGVSVQVQTHNGTINSGAEALTLATQQNAALVVWGSAQLGSIDAQYAINPAGCVHCSAQPVAIAECTEDSQAHFVSTPDDKTYAVSYLLGLALYHSDQISAAVSLLNQAARSAPAARAADLNLAAVYTYRGSALRERGLINEAMGSYNRALDFNPDDLCVRAQRAALYDVLQLWNESMADYNAIVSAAPSADWAYRARAVSFRAQELFDSAVNDLNSAAQLDAADPANAYWRGATAYAMNDYANAVTQFSEAIRLAPSSANAFAWRAAANREQGQIDAAFTDFNEAIRLAPQMSAYYSSVGDLYYNQQRYAEAIANKNRAIVLEPNNSRYYTDLGGIYYFAQQDYATAVEIYTQALYADGNNATAYYYRGLSQVELGRPDAAIGDFSAAINLDPDNGGYVEARARAHSDVGQYEEALVDFNEAIRLQPESATLYSLIGDVYYALGRYQEAIDSETRAIALDPNNARRYTDLAGIYLFALNDDEMAATIYTRALEADPQDSVALFYRGRAALNLGRVDQARADIQAAMQIDPANTDYQTWLSENYQALGLSQPSF